MAASSPITRQTVGKTFIVASSLLGIAALMQMGAVGWAFAVRTWSEPQVAADRPVTQDPNSAAPSQEALVISDPFADLPVPATTRPPGPTTPAPAIPPPSKPVPIPVAKLQSPPPQTRFEELIQQGRILRERGDMTNALLKFREAQTLDPRTAQAPFEIALTYEKMGLAERAAEQWRRIYEMGEAAGSYYVAADARLRQSQAQALMQVQGGQTGAATQPVSSTNPDATLGLGSITSEEVSDPTAMHRFVLRVPLRARADARIDVRDVVIHVLFYDIVDDKNIVRTSANVNSRWASAPPDWAEGDTEVLEVEYLQAKPDPREPRREARKYFGYNVRLYYKDALQDSRAEPIRLATQFPAPPRLENDPNK